jgi:steroid 5-alpha reductase family enzyme
MSFSSRNRRNTTATASRVTPSESAISLWRVVTVGGPPVATACANSSHPNYLGEMMIYASFALMAWHWFPVLVLAWVWLGLFGVNMILKEASMSRYPEWAEYKKHSWWLIPLVL